MHGTLYLFTEMALQHWTSSAPQYETRQVFQQSLLPCGPILNVRQYEPHIAVRPYHEPSVQVPPPQEPLLPVRPHYERYVRFPIPTSQDVVVSPPQEPFINFPSNSEEWVLARPHHEPLVRVERELVDVTGSSGATCW